MIANIEMNSSRTVGDIQSEFSRVYPFLKIEFYKSNGKTKLAEAQRLNRTALLGSVGIFAEGIIHLNDLMTVGELEGLFRMQYGTTVQVSRKSGPIWLETTMTDNWTLKQQNEHGRELSEP